MLEDFLDPPKGDKYDDLIKQSCDFLEMLNLQATEVLDKVNQTSERKDDYYRSTLILLLREAIVRVDGIQSLFKNSSISTSPLLLRSLFEFFIYFKYIFDNADTVEQRTLCYYVYTVHERISMYKKHDSTDDTYKGYQDIVGESIVKNFDPVKMSALADNLESMLQKPPFKAIEDEWVLKQGKKMRFPEWYSLFCGANNFKELCKSLNMEQYYITLYHSFSVTLHGQSIHNGLAPDADGGLQISIPKYPPQITGDILDLTCTFMESICAKMNGYFFKADGPSFVKWHEYARKRSVLLQQEWKELLSKLNKAML